MGNLVESFFEVHDYHISLVVVVRCGSEILDGGDELRFALVSFPKAVLFWA